MPKDTHRTATTDLAELELPEQVTVAVAELAGTAREGLLALAVGTGLQVLQVMLAADVARLVGPKGRHNPDRSAVRHGTQPGKVTLGGRRIRGSSRSAVSRRFVAATEHALVDLLAADLAGLDLVALLVDGIRVADHTCVVALGITVEGTKIPLALAEGATENATVVRDLLTSLRERGLDTTRPILVVIDGAKALRRAVTDVFDHPGHPALPAAQAPQRHRPAPRRPGLGGGQADASRLPPPRPAGRPGRAGGTGP